MYALAGAAALLLLIILTYRMWLVRCRQAALRALVYHVSVGLRTSPSLVWWVDFGTLLGIVREGDIIPGDNDADICVVVETDEDRRRLVQVLRRCVQRNPDMRLNLKPWPDANAYRMHLGDYFLDVYHNRRSSDGRWYIGATGENSNVSVDLIGTPQPHFWRRGGAQVFLPQEPCAVLEWRYGADWRTPRPGFKGRDS